MFSTDFKKLHVILEYPYFGIPPDSPFCAILPLREEFKDISTVFGARFSQRFKMKRLMSF